MTEPDHNDPISQRLDTAIRLVQTAGEKALSYYRRPAALRISRKGHQDWVTEADTAVESLLIDAIRAQFPEDRIIGEETGDSGDMGLADRIHWVIDPIDGTTCFLNCIPQWCIAMALCSPAETLATVIYDPVQNELFSAHRGHGARLNGRPLNLNPDAGIQDGLVSVGSSPKLGAERAARYMERLLQDGGLYTRIGSTALGLAYVASGRLIGFVEPLVHPWDSWGGSLLVEEAGGHVLPHHLGPAVGRPGPAMASTPAAWPHLHTHY